MSYITALQQKGMHKNICQTLNYMSKKETTGGSQVSLCLGASLPEGRQVASLIWIKLCVLL